MSRTRAKPFPCFAADGGEFVKRGTVLIQSLKAGEANYDDNTFSPEERERLKVSHNAVRNVRLTVSG